MEVFGVQQTDSLRQYLPELWGNVFRLAKNVMQEKSNITGYCYVVEFSNGRIKAGITGNISTRLKTHKSFALASGIVATRFAHTARHANYIENEKNLIAKLEKIGGVAHGREFFEDVDFEYAAQCLRELECKGVEKRTLLPLEIIVFDASAISVKRNIPVYKINPSVAEYEKTVICRPSESGGVYEWEEVDQERFVKLFLAGVKQVAELKKPGLAIFELVYNALRDHPGEDTVRLAFSETEMKRSTFYNGLRELLEKGVLYRSPWDGVFFVNIRYMFNGDRLAFVKAYHLRGGNGKQRKLPAAG